MIEIKPIHKDAANEAVSLWHRHSKPVPNMQISFCLGIFADAPGYKLVGVVIVGNPCGRPTGKDKKLILEVRRVCFNPSFNHLKLKRWFPREDNQPEKNHQTLRNLPVTICVSQGNGQIPIAYDMTTPYKFPSMVMKWVIFFIQRYYLNIKKVWTYILKKENGRYLTESGYVQDKVFKSRNRWKRRYVKQLTKERENGTSN